MPKIDHRIHAAKLNAALVELRGLLTIFHEAKVTGVVGVPQGRNCLRYFIFHVATNLRQGLLISLCDWCAAERAPVLSSLLDRFAARLADHPAATDAKIWLLIQVPVLATDRAPRSHPCRKWLWLRVHLAPRASGLVFRGDTSADLVGVRTRRGAVEDLLRRRRRGFRPRRLRRTLVSDLFARLPVSAVAPVDALALGRTVGRRAATLASLGLVGATNRTGLVGQEGFRARLSRFIFVTLFY